jgi:hypothetical protein
VRVNIDKDELYPFFDASTGWDWGKPVEVPDEMWANWQSVMEQFWEVQEQMHKYLRGE